MLKILFLADDGYNAEVVRDHIQAFFCHSRFKLTLLNPCRDRLFPDPLSHYDVVVVHYSIFILSQWYLSEDMAEAIRAFPGLKVQIIQDEYRQVNQMAERMGWLGMHLIFTILQGDAVAQGYPQACIAHATKHSVNVTGFPPKHLLHYPRLPLKKRPLDIVYRGRDVPFFLGRLGQEKKLIGQGVLSRAPDYNLAVDIAWSEDARIYGKSWYDFTASGRATLASESGSSVWDFTGDIENKVKSYLEECPNASFAEVYERFLTPYDGKIIYRAPSPRLFEAICLGTALVLFPGSYGNIFVPDRHYIPLQPDFSNFDDVVAQLRDVTRLEQMIARARDDIILSGRYSEAVYVAAFDNAVEHEYRARIGSIPVTAAAGTTTDTQPNGFLDAGKNISLHIWKGVSRHLRQVPFYYEQVVNCAYKTWYDPGLPRQQKLRQFFMRIRGGLAMVGQDLLSSARQAYHMEAARRTARQQRAPVPAAPSVRDKTKKHWCPYSGLSRFSRCESCKCRP